MAISERITWLTVDNDLLAVDNDHKRGVEKRENEESRENPGE